MSEIIELVRKLRESEEWNPDFALDNLVLKLKSLPDIANKFQIRNLNKDEVWQEVVWAIRHKAVRYFAEKHYRYSWKKIATKKKDMDNVLGDYFTRFSYLVVRRHLANLLKTGRRSKFPIMETLTTWKYK